MTFLDSSTVSGIFLVRFFGLGLFDSIDSKMKELQTSTTTTTPGTFHEILSRRLLLLLLLSAGGTVSFVIALARKKSGTIDDVGCIRPAELAFYIFQSGARNGAIVLREAKVCRRCSHTRLRFRFSAVLNIERAGRVRPTSRGCFATWRFHFDTLHSHRWPMGVHRVHVDYRHTRGKLVEDFVGIPLFSSNLERENGMPRTVAL